MPNQPNTPQQQNQDKFRQPPGRERQDHQGAQQPGQQPGQRKEDDKWKDPNRQGAQHRPDEGKVGQDTDGDGKTVQPGQKPGQSHGTGKMPDQKR